MKKLIEGYKRFYSRYFGKDSPYKKLVQEGQKPKVLVIACSDSRVDPAIILGCEPGDIFVVRNVANLVPPAETSPSMTAALKYGVLGLGITDILVFGHRHCGGIRALIESSPLVEEWMEVAKPALQRVQEKHPHSSLEEKCHLCEKESLLLSLENLRTYPWIDDKIHLHAWYFCLDSGQIESYHADKKQFAII